MKLFYVAGILLSLAVLLEAVVAARHRDEDNAVEAEQRRGRTGNRSKRRCKDLKPAHLVRQLARHCAVRVSAGNETLPYSCARKHLPPQRTGVQDQAPICTPDYAAVHSENPANASSCPWEITSTYDRRRYPRLLGEARCLCSACNTPGSTQHCMPIRHRIPVLWRSDACRPRSKKQISTFVYVDATYDVTVGCTCVDLSRQ